MSPQKDYERVVRRREIIIIGLVRGGPIKDAVKPGKAKGRKG